MTVSFHTTNTEAGQLSKSVVCVCVRVCMCVTGRLEQGDLVYVCGSWCNDGEAVVCRSDAGVLDLPPQQIVDECAFACKTHRNT